MPETRALQHDSAQQYAPLFAALGDPVRLRLITRLQDGRARSITQLTEGMELTRQAVTKHLRVLERAGLVQASRQGRENHFTCEPASIARARDWLDQLSAEWDDAIRRLEDFLET